MLRHLILAIQIPPRRDCKFNDKSTDVLLPFRSMAEKASHLLRRWSLTHDEDGVTLIEYGLIGSILAICAIAAITLSGQSLNQFYQKIAAAIATAAGG